MSNVVQFSPRFTHEELEVIGKELEKLPFCSCSQHLSYPDLDTVIAFGHNGYALFTIVKGRGKVAIYDNDGQITDISNSLDNLSAIRLS